MTAIERYINEIKEAAKFLEQNPDWTPESGWEQELNRKSPAQAIGEIVRFLSPIACAQAIGEIVAELSWD